MKRFAVVLVVLLAASVEGAHQQPLGPNLTIYSDLALVEELRTLRVSPGGNEYVVENLPKSVLPDSVLFRPIGEIQIIEQEFLPAQELTGWQLLQNSVGQQIEVTVARGLVPKTYRGTLLSVEDSIVLQEVTGRIHIIKDLTDISLDQLSEYRKTPALRWRIQSDISGEVSGRLSYLTAGLSWSASYTAILNDAETQMRLTSWVTVHNTSGRDYANAQLTLVAGELRRVTPAVTPSLAPQAVPLAERGKDMEPQPLFEYYEYRLPQRTTLKDKQALQLTFLHANAVTVSKHYVYDTAIYPTPHVEIRFANEKAHGLGVALPAGAVRLYKETADGLRFLGEDLLGHAPVGERIALTPGRAFDLKAERVLKDRQLVGRDELGRELYRDSYEITLHNQKETDVIIEVKERLQGIWRIISAEPNYEKLDASTVLFRVLVKARGMSRVTYTVEWRY
ncbi:MAG: DUF4139 domain-containing protein [Candidatus Bipolaricaulota bacterium]|nr:DUF4139 domain-containing protein [Candidatus Bipolaricaulota bacterium]MDW8030955.1 DUF4139 domain-containing protein [Candidatus Bipolaricaulota bacterium]